MKYKLLIKPKAQKQLSKIDVVQASKIKKWIEKNLLNCSDPYFQGKALKGKLSKYWRYRVGNYRILTQIEDDKILISIVQIGHRKEIYD